MIKFKIKFMKNYTVFNDIFNKFLTYSSSNSSSFFPNYSNFYLSGSHNFPRSSLLYKWPLSDNNNIFFPSPHHFISKTLP